MDYDAPQWPKGIADGVVDKPILESTPSSSRETLEKRANRAHKGQQQEANLSCPRCNSTNTKFCYYNNYSLSQPRYFCKSCRRYWTRGGSLRNVPMGGGSRKNKRSSPSSSIITSSSKKNVSGLIQSDPQNPSSIQGHDLNLASYGSNVPLLPQNPSSFTSSELSLGNFTAPISNFPLPGSADLISNAYPSGRLFSSLQELKPMLHCSSIDNSNNNGFASGIHENDNSRGQGEHSPGGTNYWNSSGSGMLGGGGGSWQL